MPPTPWQTETRALSIWAGVVPRIWRTLSCNAYMPECMYERRPPLVLSGIIMGDAGLGKGLGAVDTERARGVKSSIWLTVGVSTLSPVPRR